MPTNIALYPWFQFCRSLLFWQAIWFLYFQKELSAAEAILLAAIYDITTTALEIPSGYISDRLGRRLTLIIAIAIKIAAALLLAFGDEFAIFALAQALLGASMAFTSGTDTSLLFESLSPATRNKTIERHEQRAWRFSFTGLALSAVTGGLLAAIAPMWAFIATAIAALVALLIATQFTEPPHQRWQATFRISGRNPNRNAGAQRAALTAAFQRPTLRWLFCLAAGMYTLSHVPFVFGQPFILEAVNAAKIDLDASIVSGGVTATMMLVSVATSWLAPALQRRLGVGPVLLIALGMQVAQIALLALTNHPAAIALLFLRMVPDSLAKPYILARIHPLLTDSARATYLSIQSFCGRLIFAASLFLSTFGASGTGALAYPEIRIILVGYAAAGLIMLIALTHTIRRAEID